MCIEAVEIEIRLFTTRAAQGDGDPAAVVEYGQGHDVQAEGEDCGELVGYVDDGTGTYSYANADSLVLPAVLTRKYKCLRTG